MASIDTNRAGDASTLPWPSTSYAWFVVTALSLTNLVSYLERQLITLMFGPIKKDFALSDTEIALLQGVAFTICYIVFGLVFGRMADRKNRKWIIILGVTAWSIATMACGLARNFWQLFLARVSVGVGEASLGPSAYSLMSDLFPREKLTSAIGVFAATNNLGAGLALVVGGAAIQIISQFPPLVLPIFGIFAVWQTTFLFVGAVGMLVLVPLAFVKEPMRRGLAQSKAAEGGGVPFAEIWAFMKRNKAVFLVMFIAYPLKNAFHLGAIIWMPTFFIRVWEFEAHSIGYIFGTMLAFLGAAGIYSGTRLVDYLLARGYSDAYFRAALYTMLPYAAIQIMVPFMPSATAALALLSVATYIGSFAYGGLMTAIQVVTPNQMRGQILSLWFFVNSIASLAGGPTLIALATDNIFQDEMAVGYSVSLMCVLLAPISFVLLWAGLKPLRESVERARAWAGSAAPAAH